MAAGVCVCVDGGMGFLAEEPDLHFDVPNRSLINACGMSKQCLNIGSKEEPQGMANGPRGDPIHDARAPRAEGPSSFTCPLPLLAPCSQGPQGVNLNSSCSYTAPRPPSRRCIPNAQITASEP